MQRQVGAALPSTRAWRSVALVNDEQLQRFASGWIASWNTHDLERILSHYAEDVEFMSPLLEQLPGEASGRLTGKAALRNHVIRRLQAAPELRLHLQHALGGIDGCTLIYRDTLDQLTAETMTFGTDGLVLAAGVACSGVTAGSDAMEWRRGDYLLTDDCARMDLDAICRMLQATYWANDRSLEVIAKGIHHSTCLHLLHEGRQVGLIRGVTDHATFTWVCDVIVDETHRGRGLGKWMVACFLEHPALQTISHHLCTKDAHSLYEGFGFQRIEAMRRSDRPMPFLIKSPENEG